METHHGENARRRQRAQYQEYQKNALMVAFEETGGYPETSDLEDLCQRIDIQVQRARIWFQNRRAKERQAFDRQKLMLTSEEESALLKVLEDPSEADFHRLSRKLKIPLLRVQIWFANRREYLKKHDRTFTNLTTPPDAAVTVTKHCKPPTESSVPSPVNQPKRSSLPFRQTPASIPFSGVQPSNQFQERKRNNVDPSAVNYNSTKTRPLNNVLEKSKITNRIAPLDSVLAQGKRTTEKFGHPNNVLAQDNRTKHFGQPNKVLAQGRRTTKRFGHPNNVLTQVSRTTEKFGHPNNVPAQGNRTTERFGHPNKVIANDKGTSEKHMHPNHLQAQGNKTTEMESLNNGLVQGKRPTDMLVLSKKEISSTSGSIEVLDLSNKSGVPSSVYVSNNSPSPVIDSSNAALAQNKENEGTIGYNGTIDARISHQSQQNQHVQQGRLSKSEHVQQDQCSKWNQNVHQQKQSGFAMERRHINSEIPNNQGQQLTFSKIPSTDLSSHQHVQNQRQDGQSLMSNQQVQQNQQPNQHQHLHTKNIQKNQKQSFIAPRVTQGRNEKKINRKHKLRQILPKVSETVTMTPSAIAQNPIHVNSAQHHRTNFDIARILGTEDVRAVQTDNSATDAVNSTRQIVLGPKFQESNPITQSTIANSQIIEKDHSGKTVQANVENREVKTLEIYPKHPKLESYSKLKESEVVSPACNSKDTKKSVGDGDVYITEIGSSWEGVTGVKTQPSNQGDKMHGVSSSNKQPPYIHMDVTTVTRAAPINSAQVSGGKAKSRVISEGKDKNKVISNSELVEDHPGMTSQFKIVGSRKKVKVLRRTGSVSVPSSKKIHLKRKDIEEPNSTPNELEKHVDNKQSAIVCSLTLNHEDKISRKRKSMLLSDRPQKVNCLKPDGRDLVNSSCYSNPSKYGIGQRSSARKSKNLSSERTNCANDRSERRERKVVIIDLFPENEIQPDPERTVIPDDIMDSTNAEQKDTNICETENKRPSNKRRSQDITDPDSSHHHQIQEEHSSLHDLNGDTDVLPLMITNVTSLSETANQLWSNSTISLLEDYTDDEHGGTGDDSVKPMDFLNCSPVNTEFSSRRETGDGDCRVLDKTKFGSNTTVEQVDVAGQSKNIVKYTSVHTKDKLELSHMSESGDEGKEDASQHHSEGRQIQHPRIPMCSPVHMGLSGKHGLEDNGDSRTPEVDQSAQDDNMYGNNTSLPIDRGHQKVLSSDHVTSCHSDVCAMMYSYNRDDDQASMDKLEPLYSSKIDTPEEGKSKSLTEVDNIRTIDTDATHSDAKLKSFLKIGAKDINTTDMHSTEYDFNSKACVNSGSECNVLMNVHTNNDDMNTESMGSGLKDSDCEIVTEKCVWIPHSLRC